MKSKNLPKLELPPLPGQTPPAPSEPETPPVKAAPEVQAIPKGELDPLLDAAVKSQPDVAPAPQPKPKPEPTSEPTPEPAAKPRNYTPLIAGGIALLIGLSAALLTGGKVSGNRNSHPQPNTPRAPLRNDWA